MKKIFDYTAQELFRMLNDSSECTQIEAKGKADILRSEKGGKPDKFNYHSLMETVCSFSNEPDLGGGVILLGVGENKDDFFQRFSVEGIRDTDQAQLDIATQCKTIFNIPVYPQIRVEVVDGQNILVIRVPELSQRQKPLFFKQQGLPKGAYRRVGSADLHCTEDDLRVFYIDSVTGYDQTPIPGATVDEVDPEAIKRYRLLRKQVNPNAEELVYNDQDLLESLGCVCPENKRQLNLAGVLLFGTYKLQRRTIPTARIDYIRVPGNKWVEDPEASFHSIDMLGAQLLTLYRLVDAVNSDLPKGFLLREGELQADSTGLPVRVLREAIVNAMMHRSYREGRPTQIIRYDNRIEITNAGFSLKEPEELGTPGSKIRNTVLAPIFHDTNLAETKGTGIKRMRELMAKAHLAQPTFESSRDQNEFTIRLLLHHFLCDEDLKWLAQFETDDLNDAQKTALIFVREVGAIDNMTYRQMSNTETLKASRELRAMRDAGLLTDRGKGSATYYKPGDRLLAAMQTRYQGDTERYQGDTERYQGNAERYHGDVAPSQTIDGQGDGKSVDDQKYHGMEEKYHALPSNVRWKLEGLGAHASKGQLREAILLLCSVQPMTKENLAEYLHRNADYIRIKFLKDMIKAKELRFRFPEMVKHPSQAYITNQQQEKPHE